MPVIGSSTCSVGGAHRVDLLGEGGGVDAAVVLELQEQAVAAGGRERRPSNAQRRSLVVGMHVQEGEVALAQRDEVAARRRGRAATATGRPSRVTVKRSSARRRRGRAVGERDVVAVDVARSPAARAAARSATAPSTVRSAAERRAASPPRGEVGEDAVGARVGQRRAATVQRAVGAAARVQVLEAGQVAAHDDQVHALACARRRSRARSAPWRSTMRNAKRSRSPARAVAGATRRRPFSATPRPWAVGERSGAPRRARRGRRRARLAAPCRRRPSRPCRCRRPTWLRRARRRRRHRQRALPTASAPPKMAASAAR